MENQTLNGLRRTSTDSDGPVWDTGIYEGSVRKMSTWRAGWLSGMTWTVKNTSKVKRASMKTNTVLKSGQAIRRRKYLNAQ